MTGAIASDVLLAYLLRGWRGPDLQTMFDLADIAPELQALADAYRAGWRPPVVVHDAPFAADAITIAGLSSAKRYRCYLTATPRSGADDLVLLQPNGANSGGSTPYLDGGAAVGRCGALTIGYLHRAVPITAFAIQIEPRVEGAIAVFTSGGSSYGTAVNGGLICSGAFTADYSSLTFALGGVHAGRLVVVEETP